MFLVWCWMWWGWNEAGAGWKQIDPLVVIFPLYSLINIVVNFPIHMSLFIVQCILELCMYFISNRFVLNKISRYLYIACCLLFYVCVCKNRSGDLSWIESDDNSDKRRRRSAWIKRRLFYHSVYLLILEKVIVILSFVVLSD